MKMTPPARPRRDSGMCGSTVGAASTMIPAPAKPETKRQTKNQAKLNGKALAKKARLATTIITRSNAALSKRAASLPASSAPAR